MQHPTIRRTLLLSLALATAGMTVVAVVSAIAVYRLDARTALGFIAVTTGAAIAVFGALMIRLRRLLSEPLASVQAAVRHLARGELNVHVRIDGVSEFKSLALDLDSMAAEFRRRISEISGQRNQLEAVLTSMLEGVIVLDESLRIVSMNEAGGRLLRVSPSGARGETLIEYVRNAQLEEIARETIDGDAPVERTITLYRDQPLHLQIHATSLEHDSVESSGAVLVMNDITRLVQLETLRRDFVANVSHELRTPVTSIKGFVETLIDDAGQSIEERERFLQIVLHHTNRLNSIIEDLLSLSRLEQAGQRVRATRFSPAALIESALDVCASRIAEKSITVNRRIAALEAMGSPNLLEQALVNLIDNAVKYSSAGSAIDIEGSSDERTLTLCVVDRGTGIPARDLPRIFERFYRTDQARSRELGGTGLGLAIVKHIALAHGGGVDVRSVYGRGSTFVITIPQDMSAPPELHEEPQQHL